MEKTSGCSMRKDSLDQQQISLISAHSYQRYLLYSEWSKTSFFMLGEMSVQSGISIFWPRDPYPPKSWGHLKKSGDSIINNQNFIENVPVAFRCGYFAPCNLFL